MRQLKLLLIIIIAFSFLGFTIDTVSSESVQVETPSNPIDIEREYLLEKVNSLIDSTSISEAIVVWCMNHSTDHNLCINNVVGVATAESWLFKQGMKPSNNWFGWLTKTENGYKKKRFTSIEEGIIQWIKMYERLWWENRDTWEKRLSWKYCTSECTYRIKNYNSGIEKLWLD